MNESRRSFFGAAAGAGTVGDLDLVVVKDTDRPFHDRLREVAQVVRWKHASGVIVLTPQEFEEMQRSNPFIQREAIEKGRVLHGAARATVA